MAASFDEAMGRLQIDLFNAAAAADRHELEATGDTDLDYVRAANEALGYVAGLQYEAQESARKVLDDHQAQAASIMATVLKGGVGLAAGPAHGPAKAAWWLFRTAAKRGIGNITQVDDTGVEQLEDTAARAALAVPWQTAALMLDAGIRFDVPPPDSISDGAGGLAPFADIAWDPQKLSAFTQWLRDNGLNKAGELKVPGAQAHSIAVSFAGMADNVEKLFSDDPALTKVRDAHRHRDR